MNYYWSQKNLCLLQTIKKEIKNLTKKPMEKLLKRLNKWYTFNLHKFIRYISCIEPFNIVIGFNYKIYLYFLSIKMFYSFFLFFTKKVLEKYKFQSSSLWCWFYEFSFWWRFSMEYDKIIIISFVYLFCFLQKKLILII